MDRQSELLGHHGSRCRRAEAVDTEHSPRVTDDVSPAQSDAGLHGELPFGSGRYVIADAEYSLGRLEQAEARFAEDADANGVIDYLEAVYARVKLAL